MVKTRMGDGRAIEMGEKEIRNDIFEGVEDAADRAKVDPLTEDEVNRLTEIYSLPNRFVGTTQGNEVVLTVDAGHLKVRRSPVSIGKITDIEIFERVFCMDTAEHAHVDYSFKPVKPIVSEEQVELEKALLSTVLPVFYGAMPNLSLYSKPDGQFENPAELMPKGKIEEARAAFEGMIEQAIQDMVYVSSKMYQSGADGINFDTTGSSGEPDVYAAFKAIEKIKEKHPDVCIQLGMAGEHILGFHGELEYEGVNLAGLYPHEQVKLAEKAGVDIFGAVANINTSESIPKNIGRAVTYMKACSEAADIPVFANVGMGVGGVPMVATPPIDSVSRASVAMTEIGKMDGL